MHIFPAAVQVHLLSAQDSATCGVIGTNNQTEFTAERDLRFYLNTASPAPCNGTITSLSYCYYGPGNLFLASYRVTLAVYRRISNDSGEFYQRVSDVFTAVRYSILSPFGPYISGGFNCHNIFELGDEDVEVQAGDIVGACIFDPDNVLFFINSQLDVIGDANGYSLHVMNDVSDCDFGAIPSTVEATDLREVSSRILHIHAEISKFLIRVITPYCR